MLQSSLQLLLGLICTYSVVVYISNFLLEVFARIDMLSPFTHFPYPLFLPPYLHIELNQTSLKLYLLLRVHVLRYPSTVFEQPPAGVNPFWDVN